MEQVETGLPELVHLDGALLVADKPAGLLAVPGRGEDKQDCLSARIQKTFPDALIVHRLDMATSGLLLFARGPEMQRELSLLFQQRLVAKRYVAVVSGRVAHEAGEVDLPLIADWPNRPLQKVDTELGKPSLTRYRVLGYGSVHGSTGCACAVGANAPYSHGLPLAGAPRTADEHGFTRVELEPITGRTHQLRVHMGAIGHPILGDALYGDAGSAPRLLLHACSLSFVHPLSGKPLSLASEAPF